MQTRLGTGLEGEGDACGCGGNTATESTGEEACRLESRTVARRYLLHVAGFHEVESLLPIILRTGAQMGSSQNRVETIQTCLGQDVIDDGAEPCMGASEDEDGPFAGVQDQAQIIPKRIRPETVSVPYNESLVPALPVSGPRDLTGDGDPRCDFPQGRGKVESCSLPFEVFPCEGNADRPRLGSIRSVELGKAFDEQVRVGEDRRLPAQIKEIGEPAGVVVVTVAQGDKAHL